MTSPEIPPKYWSFSSFSICKTKKFYLTNGRRLSVYYCVIVARGRLPTTKKPILPKGLIKGRWPLFRKISHHLNLSLTRSYSPDNLRSCQSTENIDCLLKENNVPPGVREKGVNKWRTCGLNSSAGFNRYCVGCAPGGAFDNTSSNLSLGTGRLYSSM